MVAGPAFIHLYANEKFQESKRLNNAFLNIYLFPFLFISVFTILIPVDFYKLISGFDGAILKEYITVLRFSGIWLTLVIINNFFGNILLSRKFFTISIFGQVVAAIITLVLILLAKKQYGINSFLYGQLIGNLICLFVYFYFLRKKIKQTFSLFNFKLPVKVIRELLAAVINSVPTLVINFLLVYFLSRLLTGQLSAYNYGSNLANLPDVILLSQIISVIGVKLSELSAKEGQHGLFSFFSYYSRHLFFFMIILAIIFSLFSTLVIEIIYGKKDLDKVVFTGAVYTLNIMVLALPFKALDVLHNRLFASLQALTNLVRFTLPVKIINIGLLILLANLFGFTGIVIHQLLLPVIMVVIEFLFLKKFMMKNIFTNYLKDIFFLFLIGACMFVLLVLFKSYFFEELDWMLMILCVALMTVVMIVLSEKLFGLTSFGKLTLIRFRSIKLLLNRRH